MPGKREVRKEPKVENEKFKKGQKNQLLHVLHIKFIVF